MFAEFKSRFVRLHFACHNFVDDCRNRSRHFPPVIPLVVHDRIKLNDLPQAGFGLCVAFEFSDGTKATR
jgi:hypothetical protein